MKYLFVVLSALLVLPVTARAHWVTKIVLFEVDTKDPKQISAALPMFPMLQLHLSARELVSETKMVVDHLGGRIAIMKWENDEECTVADPSSVKEVQTSDSSGGLHFVDKPSEHHGEELRMGLLIPCSGQPSSVVSRSY